MLKPEDIIITEIVRMKCQNCGAFKRKRDCPPYAPLLERAREIIAKYEKYFLFIWRSDGSVAWREGFPKEKLVVKKERGLKGTAMGVQTSIHDQMIVLRKKYVKDGFRARAWIAGPCHKCRVCVMPEEGKCKKGLALPSMEAWGMDVFGMYDSIGIEYQHPVIDFITCASLLGVRKA